MPEKVLLLGNEAIARGAYEAGCQVASAYPGTPSTEILETIARQYKGIRSQWSPNEKVALEVACGAAIAGVRSLAAMKHVGLNVAADPLFTFSYTGINSALVIINADDPGPWSSQNEQDNRHLARASKVPMIEPSDPAEAKEFTKMAFDMSEKFDVPVIVRITTRIAHSQGLVELGEAPDSLPVKDFVRRPAKHVMIPVFVRQRHKFKEEEQIPRLKDFSNNSGLNRIEWGKNNKRGIITDSVAYQYVKETCPDDSILKIGMCWPMPDRVIREFAGNVEEICVVEELDPYIEDYVKSLGINVEIGKNVIPILGELTPGIVGAALNGKTFSRNVPLYESEKIPDRPPLLCAGCPHSFVYTVLKKLDLHVNGDIGCYTLGVLPPYSSMHTQGCMGASIGMHLGMEKAKPDMARKSVAIIGDSTFVHSGITPLIDLVYNKGTGTIIILDNRTTAMTGHQEHPGSGKTISGEETHRLDLEMLSKAVGVRRVVTVDPKNMDEFERVVKEEVAAEEPSVIISLRKCSLQK
ncbi:MAG: thiamine pyrophosphate-dependent enzyme [Leptospirales bacterium]|nr:thiamine pyrophosphate-dependent enzyme [Leptospirales bacterium]